MADTYLLDTNMIGRLADDRQYEEADQETRRFREHVCAVSDARLLVCAITLGEVEYGLESAPRLDDGKKAAVRRIMRSFGYVLDIGRDTAVPHYAQARARLFSKFALKVVRGERAKVRRVEDLVERTTGKTLGIQENDLWLASIALQYKLVLVTSDKLTRIREVCPDLRVENWLEA